MTSARGLPEGVACIIPVLQIEDARAICTVAAVVRRTSYTTAMECAGLLAIFAISSGAFGITPRKRTGPFLPSSVNADENGRHHIDIRAHSSSSCTSACMASYHALFIGTDSRGRE
jgi:hypothetical protein